MQKRRNQKTAKKKAVSSKFSLNPGDKIAIVAPGSHAPFEIMQKGAKVLQTWGYEVEVFSQDLNPQIFLSNTDEERFRLLKKALLDPKVKAIWCLRGGYGAIRLLPFLEKMKKPKDFKLLIGLSDVSSLHAHFNFKWNWPTLHGPLVDRLATGRTREQDVAELKNILSGQQPVSTFTHLTPINKPAEKLKKLSGPLVGGNLMVVTSTLGTKAQLKTKGQILFFEEIFERSYRIDRCLHQLKQAGVFSGARAVVFGDFTKCEEPDGENYVAETLKRFCQELKIPAFIGVECGHGEAQRPLFFNTKAVLFGSTDANMTISNEIQCK